MAEGAAPRALCRALAVALTAPAPVLAQTGVSPAVPFELTVREPRAFGYTLGEVIRREVELRVRPPYDLVPGSLPGPGRTDLWLSLDPPRVETGRDGDVKVYRIGLDYHIVNLAEPEQVLTVPAWPLTVDDGRQSRTASIPGRRFAARLVAPRRSEFPDLQPLAAPPALPTGGYTAAAAAGAALALAGLALLGWVYGWLPLAERRNRPFARLARALGRGAAGEGRRRELARRIHRAFDASAGQSVFLENLGVLFAARPGFAPLREQVETFYRRSRHDFFLPEAAGPAPDGAGPGPLEPRFMAELVRHLARAERGF